MAVLRMRRKQPPFQIIICNAIAMMKSKDRLKLERQLRKWQDAPVPPGYDTPFGFFSKHWPEEFARIGRRTLTVVELDYKPLRVRSRRWGFEVITVKGPTAAKRRGNVLAFTLEVLGSFYLTDSFGGPHNEQLTE